MTSEKPAAAGGVPPNRRRRRTNSQNAAAGGGVWCFDVIDIIDELKEKGSQPGLEVLFVGETVYLMIGSVQSFAMAKWKDKRPKRNFL